MLFLQCYGQPFYRLASIYLVCFLKIGGNRTVGRKKIRSEQPERLRRKAAVVQEGNHKENIPCSGHASEETEQLLRVEEAEKGNVSPCVCLAGT